MDINERLGAAPLLGRAEEKEISRRLHAREKELKALQKDLARCSSKKGGFKKRKALKLRISGLKAKLRIERNTLVAANLRLVISIAKKYFHSHFELSDLIQEGGVGLMRMAERYNPEAGCRFSTYASWWIRQAISRAISDKARTVRIPVHILELMTRMTRMSARFQEEYGREPTVREFCRRLHVKAEKIQTALVLMQVTVSLNESPSDNQTEEPVQQLEDRESPSPWESVHATLRDEALYRVLGKLPERESRILRLRYGLGSPRTHTLREVGKYFHVSRERIRQIEGEALAKLRDPGFSEGLHDYYHA